MKQLTLDDFLTEPIMTPEVFNKLLDDITQHMKTVLGSKANEYAKGIKCDRMHNFKRAAKERNVTPENALFGFMLKHWVSMLDMLDDIDAGNPTPSKEYVSEKLGDIRNYLVLLQALIEERRIREQT